MQRLIPYFLLTFGAAATLSSVPSWAQGVYWTEHGSSEVRVAGLDGSNPRKLIENHVPGRKIAIDTVGRHLYWFNRDAIVRSSLAGTDIVELIALSGLSQYVTGFAIDPSGQKMYWAIDSTNDSIYWANLDGSNDGILISLPSSKTSPGGIGIDSVRGKIYWTEEGTHRIQGANLNGSSVETFRAGVITVKDVSVDPSDGKVFWTEAVKGLICRADFDGSNVVIVKSGLDFPSHLLVDSTAAKLYWSENAVGSTLTNPKHNIRRCNLDGSNVEPVRLNVIEGVGSFDVDPTDGHLYTATAIEENWATAIERSNLDGSSLVTLIKPKFIQPRDLAIDEETSRLLFLAGDWGTSTVKLLEADLYNPDTFSTTPVVPYAAGLAIHPTTGTIYSGDIRDCDSASPDSRILKYEAGWQPVVSGLECPVGVAVTVGKLYWTDTPRRIIQRSNLNGSGKETIVTLPDRYPRAIAVDSVGGKLYWSDYVGPTLEWEIRRANLDGTAQQILFSGPFPVIALTLDLINGRMYWLTESSIMRSYLHGANVETILTFTGVAIGFGGIAVNPCVPSECGGKKNRFLSYDAADASARAGEPIAIRVKLVDLPEFPASNGQVFWLGASTQVQDAVADETFNAARLQCTPLVQDWSPLGLVHLYGAEIVPDSTYEIRYATAACVALGEESCMSSPATLRTGHWGDVRYPFFSGQPSFEPSFVDVAAVVDKFRELPGAPSRLRAKLYGSVPDPTTPVNFLDIGSSVDSFRGFAYPFAGPGTCP